MPNGLKTKTAQVKNIDWMHKPDGVGVDGKELPAKPLQVEFGAVKKEEGKPAESHWYTADAVRNKIRCQTRAVDTVDAAHPRL